MVSGGYSRWFELCVTSYLGVSFFVNHWRELLRTSEALQEQARLLNLSSDAIIIRDEVGNIGYWNSGAERMYGWGAAEMRASSGWALLKTIFPVDRSEIDRALEATGRWAGQLQTVHERRNIRLLLPVGGFRKGSGLSVNESWKLIRMSLR